jgi:hypothetical protein
MYRTDDGFGNDGENPGAGAEGATIGRNLPIVPEKFREATDYPYEVPSLLQALSLLPLSSSLPGEQCTLHQHHLLNSSIPIQLFFVKVCETFCYGCNLKRLNMLLSGCLSHCACALL